MPARENVLPPSAIVTVMLSEWSALMPSEVQAAASSQRVANRPDQRDKENAQRDEADYLVLAASLCNSERLRLLCEIAP
jgi:hypothetical protein